MIHLINAISFLYILREGVVGKSKYKRSLFTYPTRLRFKLFACRWALPRIGILHRADILHGRVPLALNLILPMRSVAVNLECPRMRITIDALLSGADPRPRRVACRIAIPVAGVLVDARVKVVAFKHVVGHANPVVLGTQILRLILDGPSVVGGLEQAVVRRRLPRVANLLFHVLG